MGRRTVVCGCLGLGRCLLAERLSVNSLNKHHMCCACSLVRVRRFGPQPLELGGQR